jgi:hypothetical protein
MISIKKNKLLKWDYNVFDYTHERNKVLTGRELSAVSYTQGKQSLLRGICITKRSKRLGLLRASFVLRRTLFGYKFFVDFPFYLLDLTDIEVVDFSYSRKITSSRLKARILV